MLSRKKISAFSGLLLGIVLLGYSATSLTAADTKPLPSWREGTSRAAIVNFVQQVCDENSPDFVPVPARIVVFDNDGTLWTEKPVYTQALFILDRIRQLSVAHPEWQTTEPFASALKGDLHGVIAEGEKALMELLMVTHAGQSTEEFAQIVKDWLKTAQHPFLKRPYTKCVYQPMLELLDYLRSHHFKIYIVSGGGIEFMRPWIEVTYGIPPEQVIGSSIKTRYEIQNGKPVILRLPEIDFIDDGPGKPVGINKFIGRRPIAAFGNSDGDFQMLEWITAGSGPRLGAIVHHTDSEREFAYDRKSSIGKLDHALRAAPERGWIIIDMKQDWKTIFPPEQTP